MFFSTDIQNQQDVIAAHLQGLRDSADRYRTFQLTRPRHLRRLHNTEHDR